jgi:hypothetical protein
MPRKLPMPARCHDDRPPLFAGDPARPEDGRERLPEPSPPRWLNCSSAPAEFYRPLFIARTGAEPTSKAALACAGLVFIGAVLPIDPCAENEEEQGSDDSE